MNSISSFSYFNEAEAEGAVAVVRLEAVAIQHAAAPSEVDPAATM